MWQNRGYSFKGGCREGLATKVTLESGKGEVSVVCSHLLKPPLPSPGPSCLLYPTLTWQ